jgi:hypothetical protein
MGIAFAVNSLMFSLIYLSRELMYCSLLLRTICTLQHVDANANIDVNVNANANANANVLLV